MSFDAKGLASRCAEAGTGSESDWLRGLENARLTLNPHDLPDADLSKIALACATPESLGVLVRLIYGDGKDHPHEGRFGQLFLRQVSDSPFSLSQWTEAIGEFHAWLGQRKTRATLSKMLGYLECCSASAEAKSGSQTLSQLLKSMLENFGFAN